MIDNDWVSQITDKKQRYLVWFSCGAASSVAAKLALIKYPKEQVNIVYCDTSDSEHPDNLRFLHDVEIWLDKKITKIKNINFKNIDEVFEKRKYLSGISGAPCTVEMKKVPRFHYQLPDDIHIFGYTADEKHRIISFERNNPELNLVWILRDLNYSKQDCFDYLESQGIKVSEMYKLGFQHSNCVGCVKAQSPHYWKQIRTLFPDVFKKRVDQSKRFNVKLVRLDNKRISLEELPEDNDRLWPYFTKVLEDISCGPQCTYIEEENLDKK